MTRSLTLVFSAKLMPVARLLGGLQVPSHSLTPVDLGASKDHLSQGQAISGGSPGQSLEWSQAGAHSSCPPGRSWTDVE